MYDYAALTHRQICLRMCLRKKIFDILQKIRYTRRLFVSVGNKFGTFASHSPSAYGYRPISEASPQFQRMLRMLSFAVNFRKHSQAIGNVRHSEAFATFVRHLQGICNVRRYIFIIWYKLWIDSKYFHLGHISCQRLPVHYELLTIVENDANGLKNNIK